MIKGLKVKVLNSIIDRMESVGDYVFIDIDELWEVATNSQDRPTFFRPDTVISMAQETIDYRDYHYFVYDKHTLIVSRPEFVDIVKLKWAVKHYGT